MTLTGLEQDSEGFLAAVDPFDHERRFLITRRQAARLARVVAPRTAFQVYDAARPIAYTRTTYFDTPDLSLFRSCDGPVARRLRLREYAFAVQPGRGAVLSGLSFIELKQVAGDVRSKVRLCAPPGVLAELMHSRGRSTATWVGFGGQGQALRVIQEELASAEHTPHLTTWYRRSCLAGENGTVRITLDEELAFCLPQPPGMAGEHVQPTGVVARGPAYLLEVKLQRTAPDWLAEALSDLPEATGFSKFRSGMTAVLAAEPAADGLTAAAAF